MLVAGAPQTLSAGLWNSLRTLMGAMFFFWEARRTLARTSSGFSRRTSGFFSGAFIFQTTMGEATTPSRRGYLVEAIAPMPGQDGLHVGDAIVAIGGLSLVGLPEEQIQDYFGEAFSDGVALLVCQYRDVDTYSIEGLKEAVDRRLAAATAIAVDLGRTKTW